MFLFFCILVPLLSMCFEKNHSSYGLLPYVCPVFQQIKHFPSFINFVCSSMLKASISMALGFFSLWKNHQFEGPAFPWPWFIFVQYSHHHPPPLVIKLHSPFISIIKF